MERDPSPWRSLIGLSATVAVAFGVLFYALSVLITEEAAGSVFSVTALSLGYGGSVLVGGLLAVAVGGRIDRRGVRGVVMLGAVLGALGLAGIAAARHPWQIVAAAWFLVGPAGAMTFYEPAFVAVDQWFQGRQRAKALAVLTVVGGLAGPIFLPVTGGLVGWLGWRWTAALLGATLLVAGTVAGLWFLPPGRGRVSGPARQIRLAATVLRDRRFVLFSASTALTFGSLQAIFFHRIAVFEEAGFAVATVAAWAALSSALSFPGRYGAPFLAARIDAVAVQASAVVAVTAATALAIGVAPTWRMVGHFVVFGLGFGALLPLRALVMSGWFSGPGYGRIMGAQWTGAALAGAAGPIIVGVLADATGGYRIPMIVVTLALVAAAILSLFSGRARGPAGTDRSGREAPAGWPP